MASLATGSVNFPTSEDNLRFDEHRLAASNAELVARVATLSKEYGRTVASPAEARALLGLEAGCSTRP